MCTAGRITSVAKIEDQNPGEATAIVERTGILP